jgi:archaetidylinositol phosphate synthase
MHEPARDRILGRLLAPVGRTIGQRLPAGALSLAATAVAGGALAAFLTGENVVAGLLVLLAGLLDTAGAARRGGGFGSVLDGVSDRYADTLILAGMAAWSHAHERHPAPLAAGFVALIGALSLSYVTARVQASAGHAAAALFTWTGRDARVLVAAAGALTGQVYWALIVLAVMTHVPVAWALVRLRTRLT